MKPNAEERRDPNAPNVAITTSDYLPAEQLGMMKKVPRKSVYSVSTVMCRTLKRAMLEHGTVNSRLERKR